MIAMPEREFIEWVSEPPTRKRRGKWTEILAALRANPGRWARVTTSPSTGFATLIRQGKVGDARPGEFDAEARVDDLGNYDIYARYVGPDPADEQGGTPSP